MRGKYSILFLLIIITVGGLLGNLIGSMLGESLPLLSNSKSLGLEPPLHLDLNFLQLKFGFVLDINLAGLLGLIVSLWIFRRF